MPILEPWRCSFYSHLAIVPFLYSTEESFISFREQHICHYGNVRLSILRLVVLICSQSTFSQMLLGTLRQMRLEVNRPSYIAPVTGAPHYSRYLIDASTAGRHDRMPVSK